MEDITKNYSCGNMPGFKKLEVLPVDELDSIQIISNSEKRVIPVAGKTFGRIEAKNIQVNSDFEEGCYNISITGDFLDTSRKYDSVFNRMTAQKYIVKVKDRNNVVWIAGSKEEPLNFSFSHLSDGNAAGKHYYTLKFYRKSTEPLFISVI